MLTSKKVFQMEKELKASLSSGFFEQGTHNPMDLIIYEAYNAVQALRITLDEYEQGLRELAEEIKEEVRPKGMIS